MGKRGRLRKYKKDSSRVWRKGKYRNKTTEEVEHSRKERL